MSLKIKKVGLAVALVMSMGAASNALALSAIPAGVEPPVASNLLGVAAAQVSNSQILNISADLGDLIVGRTTGYGLNVILSEGTWAATPVIGGAATQVDVVAPNATWSLDSVTSATTSATMTLTVSPGAVALGVGDIIAFQAGSLLIQGAQATLSVPGGSVSVTVEFFDPVTATILLSTTATLVTSAEATLVTVAGSATALPAANPYSGYKVDVGSINSNSKSDFAADGVINSSNIDLEFSPGSVSVGLVVGGTSASGSTFATWNGGAGPTFQYNTGTDQLVITLTGDDLTAFTSDTVTGGNYIRLEDTVAATLGCPGTQIVASYADGVDLAVGGTTVVVTATTAVFTVPKLNAGLDTYEICMAVDGTDELLIDDQLLNVTVSVQLDSRNNKG